MELKQKDFRGITMKDINNYIECINIELNEHIREGVNWPDAVKNLMTYLNAHHFVENEGITINDETIDYFITRIISENKTVNLNFLPNNKLMTVVSKKPQFINDATLNEYRSKFFSGLENRQFAHRDLTKDKETIKTYTDFFNQRGSPFPKKQKQQKIGKLGMNELTDIVLTMNQDIKQIKDAQSLAGAQAWVQKHGPELYHVEDVDINGDNIPDIIVKNKDNIPVIVNGYTTCDSTYPYRYAYYTEYPTREARKAARELGDTFRERIKGMYNPQYDEYGMKIQRDKQGNPMFTNSEGLLFEQKMKNSGYTKIMRPKDKTPYQAFVKCIVKPIYDAVKQINTLLGKSTQSQLLTKVAAVMWNETILYPAMAYVYGHDVTKVSDAEWKKLRNKAEVKNAILHYVQYYLAKPVRILEFIKLFVVVCNETGLNPIPTEATPFIPGIIKCDFLNITKYPALNDTEGWADIDRRFEDKFGTPEHPI